MAAKSEIIMTIKPRSGGPISAECSLTKNPPDDLMDDFNDGEFFQIEDFTLGVGMSEGDGTTPKAGARTTSFGRWRNEALGGAATRYSLNVEPVAFSRVMDQASTALFQACCDSRTWASAAIVSRRAVGGAAGPKAYLRLDFTDVLITDLDWEDDEQIKEKYKFICRGLKMHYKPQASDGTLAAAIPGVWPKTKG